MRTRSRLASLAATAALLSAACTTLEPLADRRAALDAQIRMGAQSGALTAAEAADLRAEQLLISDRARELSRDGVSGSDQQAVDDLYEALSARLAVQLHNIADRDVQGAEWVTTQNRWISVDARQKRLDARIEEGVRAGRLTRGEADRLRAEFRAIADLEAFYQAQGLSLSEQADLDLRFDRLSERLSAERRDGQLRTWFGGNDWTDQGGVWVSIDARQRELERRIDQGLRQGQLSRSEAARLRREFHNLALVEQSYRVNGLTEGERAYLDNSFDTLAAAIFFNRIDEPQEAAPYG